MAIFYHLTSDVMDTHMDITPRPDTQQQVPFRTDGSSRPQQPPRARTVEGLGIRCGSEHKASHEATSEGYGSTSRGQMAYNQSARDYGVAGSSQTFQYSVDPPSATDSYPVGFATARIPANIDAFDFDSAVDEANGVYIHAPQPQHVPVNFSHAFHNSQKNFSYPSIKPEPSNVSLMYDETMTGQETDGAWRYDANDINIPYSNALQNQVPLVQTVSAPFPDQWVPLNGISNGLPMVYEEPAQLQPAAEISEGYSGHSRRVSMSSNAPSSVFSGESQETPYFLTPSSTPMFTPTTLVDSYSTPMSSYSPIHQIHPRSPSTSSAKALTPKLRHLRPAPYTLDSAQRHRYIDGKTMSLPSRRKTPSSLEMQAARTRALSECAGATLAAPVDRFYADYRGNFDYNLNIIRRSDPGYTALQTQTQYSHVTGAYPCEPDRPQSFPILKLRNAEEKSLPALPPPPPLCLPNREKQDLSPPPADLNPSPDDGLPKPKRLTPSFNSDVYTPRYSRGRKEQLEGWCGECECWLNMKKSAYWYHKMSKHGVNPKTKEHFDIPAEFRWKKGSTVIREGFCTICQTWVVIDTVKRTWSRWYKHAYQCQNRTEGAKMALDHRSKGHGVQMTMFQNMPLVQSVATIVPTDYPELRGFPNFMLDSIVPQMQGGGAISSSGSSGSGGGGGGGGGGVGAGGYLFNPGEIGMAM